VEQAVLFQGVEVGRGAVVRRAIVDKGVRIPAGYQMGVDLEADLRRFKVSENGIAVIGKKDLLV
jgi:glucose-1-phosphate adenylyltransferase